MNAKLILLILCIGLACAVTLYANALSINSLPNLKEDKVSSVIVRTNSSYSMGYDSHAQISCNKDETLTAGGYKSSFKDGLSVFQNGPSDDGKKWLVSARYTAGSAAGGSYRGLPPPIEIYGICMKFLS